MVPTTLLWKLGGVAAIIAAVLLYGAWEHHKGFQECKADYDAKAEQLKKESNDALAKEQNQADSDKQFLAAYYGGLLSARPKLPSGGVQASSPQGVCTAASECRSVEEDLRFEQRCAEDAAKLVRVKSWIESLKLETK